MNTPYVFKRCTKCGKWLVANTFNFYKTTNCKYELNPKCKECYKTNIRDRYNANIEKERTRSREYCRKHKSQKSEYFKKYYEAHKEENRERCKEYGKTLNGRVGRFNRACRRRQRAEQQGNGITKDQWVDMMKFFGWKCAYSGINLNRDNRTTDHIIPLAKGGANEIWNCVPMYGPYNFSKQDKDFEDWYPQQDFYDENRLSKINEWQEYAYNKWSKEEKV